MPAAVALAAGAEAYRLGRWEEARASFEEAQRVEDSPEAAEGLGKASGRPREGLGKASRFLEDGATAIAANEHAYRLYRERENTCGAGRAATGWPGIMARYMGTLPL
jgi:hypothetical protein